MPKISSVKAFALASEEPNYPGQIRYYTLARIETGNGLVGWGEGRCHNARGDMGLSTKTVIERGLAPIVVGRDPMEISNIMSDIGQYVYWSTGGASSFGLSAVEIALQDLRGKILGLPTYQLLGGKVRDKVKALASIIFDLGNPSNNIDQAKSCLKENFKAVKFDWGLIPTESFGQNFERDMEAIEEIRQTLGPSIDLILDVGKDAHWDAIEAIRWARELEKFRITWLEEPLPINDDAGHRQLKQNSRIPIAGGEWSYTLDEMQRLLTSQQLDIIQPDVGRFGGIQACKDAADLAARKNKHYSPHTWSTSVNMAASLQLLAVCSNGLVCEVLTKHSPYYDSLAINPIKQHDGYITIPTKPGIGVEVDENFVKSHDFSSS